MTNKQKLFELFSRLLEESFPEGIDAAEEELRAAGMDPDAVGTEVAAHAAAVLRRMVWPVTDDV